MAPDVARGEILDDCPGRIWNVLHWYALPFCCLCQGEGVLASSKELHLECTEQEVQGFGVGRKTVHYYGVINSVIYTFIGWTVRLILSHCIMFILYVKYKVSI